jgi:hypothetical protein
MEDIIIDLIKKGYEGETWDFKECHHDNKASLIHDILCMANQTNDEERYIIIGVQDPEYHSKIVGVKKENKRTQSSIINIFRDLSFAGDLRPNIELRTCKINKKHVDVIVVYPSNNVPFYLTEDYRHHNKLVKANYIYTRIGDTNTPIDKSCDLYHIERLWKKRFGIDKSSIDKFKVLLENFQDWNIDIGNKHVAYHKYQPECSIEFGEVEEFYEPFSGSYLNPRSYNGKLLLKYYSTIIYETEYWYLDEMRLCIPLAYNSRIMSIEESFYCYFLENDINGKLLHLFTNGRTDLSSRYQGGSQFIVFESEEQKEHFEEFLENSPQEIEKYEPSFDAVNARKYQEEENRLMAINPLVVSKIKQCFEKEKNNFR